MKKNKKKSVEEQMKLDNICIWIMAVVVVLFAIMTIVDMVMQRAIDPMRSSMIACLGCMLVALDPNNKKLKNSISVESKEKEEK